MIQGSDEWFQARLGKLTASRMSDAIAKTKTGYGASRANLMADLIVERLTGAPINGYTSPAMQWGIENEGFAKAAYEFYQGVTIEPMGFVTHPSIPESGASPDGLAGDVLVEIKCPNTATHIDTLLTKTIAGKYYTQMQWQLACTGHKGCDFVSFDPRLPENLRLFIKRVDRSDEYIEMLEKEAGQFLAEMGMKLMALSAL